MAPSNDTCRSTSVTLPRLIVTASTSVSRCESSAPWAASTSAMAVRTACSTSASPHAGQPPELGPNLSHRIAQQQFRHSTTTINESAIILIENVSDVSTVPSGSSTTSTSEAQMPALITPSIRAACASTRNSAEALPTARLLRRWLAISAKQTIETAAVYTAAMPKSGSLPSPVTRYWMIRVTLVTRPTTMTPAIMSDRNMAYRFSNASRP